METKKRVREEIKRQTTSTYDDKQRQDESEMNTEKSNNDTQRESRGVEQQTTKTNVVMWVYETASVRVEDFISLMLK